MWASNPKFSVLLHTVSYNVISSFMFSHELHELFESHVSEKLDEVRLLNISTYFAGICFAEIVQFGWKNIFMQNMRSDFFVFL